MSTSVPSTTEHYVAAIADRILATADAAIEEMNTAVAEGAPALADDAAIARDTVASNRLTLLHFLHSVAVRPDRPVPVQVPPEAVDKARNLVRRGVDLDVVIQAYRFGQESLWRRWMSVAADIVEDRVELIDVLQRSADLVFSYINDVLALEVSEIQHQRDELNQGGMTRRAETIRLLLDGAPVDPAIATARLGYPVSGPHTFVAIWSSEAGSEALERTAGDIAGRLGVRWVSHPAGTGQLWMWLAADSQVDDARWRSATSDVASGVDVLIGPSAAGPDGFRRVHHRTVDVQSLAIQESTSGGRVLTYDELMPAALAAQDMPRAAEFVRDALGGLADIDPALDPLRETVRVYLEHGESAPRAAEQLFAHRNTILQRVARAEALMGRPIETRRLQVFLALELHHRLGRAVLSSVGGPKGGARSG
ncbi:helix-turn-helix domain-containing protein [Gordonia sp. PKS22-38]|uniref:Helix-turn-helix domain-containing protein n=1 Tax=Gordonia prachuapensis TaxID=3115651 RepID=A0ABU7MWD1_9ACTN|nr:helix-turn-helix domain-containing protein [Gordonia sp. PKS22-38]